MKKDYNMASRLEDGSQEGCDHSSSSTKIVGEDGLPWPRTASSRFALGAFQGFEREDRIKNPSKIEGFLSMSVEGLEPPTNGLKGHCSTIELHAHLRGGFYHGDIRQSTAGEYC
jgi:hypothetical protein